RRPCGRWRSRDCSYGNYRLRWPPRPAYAATSSPTPTRAAAAGEPVGRRQHAAHRRCGAARRPTVGGAQDRRPDGAHRCAVLRLAGAQDAGGDGPMRIEARGLHVRLGHREVLRGLDFVAHAGEMTAVIGPNGAGKTTLLKALAGLVVPSAGTVSLRGCALAGWLPRARARAL